jgi:multiple sugar transport system permease protein
MANMVQSKKAKSGVAWIERYSVQKTLGQIALYIVLTLVAALLGLPLFWMLSTSLKTLAQQTAWPPVWLPSPLVWRNYPDALNFLPMGRYALNTIIITALSMAGVFISCPPVAYAFARIRFRGRDALFIVLVATIMLPGVIRLIPTYLMFDKMHWLNTYLPLVVPSFLGNPFYIFLLRQYFRTFPEDLADAARVDGCTELGILVRIFLPMAGPALAVVAIFTFQGHWNDFMGPLIYINKDAMRTLALGLYYFRAYQDTTNWGQMMAAASVMTLPVLVLFALFQRQFIQGVALTGMKG